MLLLDLRLELGLFVCLGFASSLFGPERCLERLGSAQCGIASAICLDGSILRGLGFGTEGGELVLELLPLEQSSLGLLRLHELQRQIVRMLCLQELGVLVLQLSDRGLLLLRLLLVSTDALSSGCRISARILDISLHSSSLLCAPALRDSSLRIRLRESFLEIPNLGVSKPGDLLSSLLVRRALVDDLLQSGQIGVSPSVLLVFRLGVLGGGEQLPLQVGDFAFCGADSRIRGPQFLVDANEI